MKLLTPDWKVPEKIKAYSTTRIGGVSKGAYQGLNLGMHVKDDPLLVEKNRQLLCEKAMLPDAPVWLNQTHSTVVAELQQPTSKLIELIDADATTTSMAGVVCTVMTADCLPVLLTDNKGSRVAAIHVGWRGLADGIIENAVKKFTFPVIAWLGPAIGCKAFEVGQDLFDLFVGHSCHAARAFTEKGNGKYLADINQLAIQRLNEAGVTDIYRSGRCTFSEPENFYSYRRDGITGRQATLIWIEK